MKLKVLEADILIGHAEVVGLDPPMGVAMAKFEPTVAFDSKRHSNVIDGEYVRDRGKLLRIEMADGIAMKCGAISVLVSPVLGECEVHLHGIVEPSFEELFAHHPHYKAYWGKQ